MVGGWRDQCLSPFPSRIDPSLPQSGDAWRGSWTESARVTLLQSGDASRGSSTKSVRAPRCRAVMLGEGLRPSLPERPCCREVMLREDLRPSLSERPRCREAMHPPPLLSCWYLRATAHLGKRNARWEWGLGSLSGRGCRYLHNNRAPRVLKHW